MNEAIFMFRAAMIVVIVGAVAWGVFEFMQMRSLMRRITK